MIFSVLSFSISIVRCPLSRTALIVLVANFLVTASSFPLESPAMDCSSLETDVGRGRDLVLGVGRDWLGFGWDSWSICWTRSILTRPEGDLCGASISIAMS